MTYLNKIMADPLANTEAEAWLLGALMRLNPAIDAVADIVTEADFSEQLFGRIYAAIVREASLGKAANPVTLKGYFENDPALGELGGIGFLARLTGEVIPMKPQDIARQLLDLSTRRRMRDGLTDAATACADLSVTPSEIVNLADAGLSVSAKDDIHQPDGVACFDELINGFGEARTGVECCVIPELDRLLGPMRPKQLVIGAGRPGMGKTALALSYALGAAQAGHGVLFVSLEMSSHELAGRMAADMCFDGREGIPFSNIRDGKLSDNQKREICRARGMMEDMPFQVVDAGNLSIGRLNMLVRRHARRMAAKGHKLELIVVDYLQLLSPDTKGRSNYEAVSEVSRGLKALAKDHGVAVFALAQLSREVEKRPDKRPQLSDLRDSGQIEQDADAVLFLLRDEYYLRQEEPEKNDPKHAEWETDLAMVQGKIEFIVAKRRNGVTGKDMGSFHGAYQAVRGQ